MKKKKIKVFLVMAVLIYLAYYYNVDYTYSHEENNTNINNTITEEDTLKVYFMDVGQADSILITYNDENMLIDAGTNESGSLLVDYFKSIGINNFKYVIGTHPHEDHIGGLDDIIDNFDIENIYIPDVITTTKTFTDLLDSIENKNLEYTIPKVDSTFTLGKCIFKVIYVGDDTSSDLNNSSIVLRMDYGNTSFLFTGDATSDTEEIILNKDIEVDVLKVGHHGSSYSTTNEFLDKVNPKYAIISVGANNSYNHPSNSTINKLEKRNITIYRTDIDNTIIIYSDGENISIDSIETNTNND